MTLAWTQVSHDITRRLPPQDTTSHEGKEATNIQCMSQVWVQTIRIRILRIEDHYPQEVQEYTYE